MDLPHCFDILVSCQTPFCYAPVIPYSGIEITWQGRYKADSLKIRQHINESQAADPMETCALQVSPWN